MAVGPRRMNCEVTVHVGELHQPGELGADGVRLGLLEAERVAVEAQRPLEVADADAEVRENGFLVVVHAS